MFVSRFQQECGAGEDSEHAKGERLFVAAGGNEVGEACKDCEPKVQPSIHPATSLRIQGWIRLLALNKAAVFCCFFSCSFFCIEQGLALSLYL